MLEFTFSVSDVLDYLGVPQEDHGIGDTKDLTCPICKGKKKLHVVYSKNYARCNKCGAGGGMLKLASEAMGISKSEAAKRIAQSRGQHHDSQERLEHQKVVEEARSYSSRKAPAADIKNRDRAYSAYLDMLSLSDRHRADLHRRGLTDEAIAVYGYKSVPVIGKETYPKLLLSQGISLRGVTGFYLAKGHWQDNIGWIRGFYIPVRDLEHRIIGLQIRQDDCSENKYIWKTSWHSKKLMEQGSNLEGIPKFHHTGFPKTGEIPVLGLTEGPLKADIAVALGYKYPIIAIPGLTNQLGLYDELAYLKEARGLRVVHDLTDMDKFKPMTYTENGIEKANHVRPLCEQIAERVIATGLEFRRYKWNTEYKGIDDYLLFRKTIGGLLNGKSRSNKNE